MNFRYLNGGRSAQPTHAVGPNMFGVEFRTNLRLATLDIDLEQTCVGVDQRVDFVDL